MTYQPIAPHDVYDAACRAWDAQTAGSAARLLAAVDAAYLAGRKRAAADIRARIGQYDDRTATDAERDVAHGLRTAADIAAQPAQSAVGDRIGPGEGERTQEPSWDDCAAVADALIAAPGTGEIWRSSYGDIVGEPLSLARVAVEALVKAGRIAAPAEQAEG